MFFPVVFGPLYQQSTAMLVANASDVGPVYANAFDWNEVAGFGISHGEAPPPYVPGACTSCVWNVPSSVAMFGSKAPPGLHAWRWTTTWSTKYGNPSQTPSSQINGMDINRSNNVVIIGVNNSPRIYAYSWSDSTGWGTKFSDPATLAGSAGQRLSFTAAEDYIIMGLPSSPFVIAYAWSNSTGFGAKLSDPTILPPDNAWGALFSPSDSLAIVHGGQGTYYLEAWPFGGGFGTKVGSPLVPPSRTVTGAKWDRTEVAVVTSQVSPGKTAAWRWLGSSWGTKYAAPATLPDHNCWSVYMSGLNTNVLIGKNATLGGQSSIVAYPWDSVNGYGVKYADPSPQVQGTCWEASFNGSTF